MRYAGPKHILHIDFDNPGSLIGLKSVVSYKNECRPNPQHASTSCHDTSVAVNCGAHRGPSGIGSRDVHNKVLGGKCLGLADRCGLLDILLPKWPSLEQTSSPWNPCLYTMEWQECWVPLFSSNSWISSWNIPARRNVSKPIFGNGETYSYLGYTRWSWGPGTV